MPVRHGRGDLVRADKRLDLGDLFDELREQGWALGGEQSGHIIDMRFAATGDGIAAALMTMRELGDRDLASVKAMEKLEPAKFTKMMAYQRNPVSRRVRTNNHVERTNRLIRLLEKVRYKWRRRKTLVRFVVLMLDRLWREWTPPKMRQAKRRQPIRSGTAQAQREQCRPAA